jgi:hypothetical protein
MLISFIICAVHVLLLNKEGKMGKPAAGIGEMRNTYKILVKKSERKRSLGRHRRNCEDNIKLYLKWKVCKRSDWIQLAQDRIR